jgi:hypothetical protein
MPRLQASPGILRAAGRELLGKSPHYQNIKVGLSRFYGLTLLSIGQAVFLSLLLPLQLKQTKLLIGFR